MDRFRAPNTFRSARYVEQAARLALEARIAELELKVKSLEEKLTALEHSVERRGADLRTLAFQLGGGET